MGRLLIVWLLIVGCSRFDRRLEYVPTNSRTMNARLSYSVYTPPDFREDEQLPLVLFLHGGGDDPAVFDRHGLSPVLDQMVRNGDVPRSVIFFPQGDNGFWMNWADGTRHYEDWIIDELMPEVVERYHTQSCPEHCHVMGVSMGAHGAIRFALHRPEKFASVSALSGPIFDSEQMIDFTNNRLYNILIPTHRIFGDTSPATIAHEDVFLRWDSPEDVPLSVFLAWGTRDRGGLKNLNIRFSRHLRENEVPHHAEEFEGNHSWVSWTPIIMRALRYQVGGEAISEEAGIDVVATARSDA